MDTQKIVKVLLTAIDSGSFTKAGEILGYTQSNLTQITKTFEDEIGFPLLIKTKRGVEPTEEAKLLLPAMRAVVAQEERLYQEIDNIRGIRKGNIRIGTYVSTSATWLPRLLEFFQNNYPEVVFEIREAGQDEMASGLLDGTLDMALMSKPDTDRIDFLPLAEDPMMVVSSSKYDLGKSASVKVSKLKDYPLIMTYSSYDRDVRKIFDKAGFTPEVKYYFRDDFAVLSMVQHGLGIAVLPEMTIRNFPGDYDCRPLLPAAYRVLGIGIKSMDHAGPLARFVIHQLQVLTSEPS